MTRDYESVVSQAWIPTPTDGLSNKTLADQTKTEKEITDVLVAVNPSKYPVLARSDHIQFAITLLVGPLPAPYTVLDASKPWLVLWNSISLSLLGADMDGESRKRVVATLAAFHNETGGFGGGPGQLSHLAPSFAAVCSICLIGAEAWDLVDREKMYEFLLSLKQPDGSFVMHIGGEVDVRGVYCALTIATLLNILTPTLAANTASFIASCQTYEGGLSSASFPFYSSDNLQGTATLGEAHGGYAFCALGAWEMLKPLEKIVPPTRQIDLDSLARWASSLQTGAIEGGGYRGRTNKLVDGCYGWWCGGIWGILRSLIEEEHGSSVGFLDNRVALQEYILLLAQQPGGGLRDKPGKSPDAYHTCYNLTGLASAQHTMVVSSKKRSALEASWKDVLKGETRIVELGSEDTQQRRELFFDNAISESQLQANERMKAIYTRTLGWMVESDFVIGKEGGFGEDQGEGNTVSQVHPVFGLPPQSIRAMMDHFYLQN